METVFKSPVGFFSADTNRVIKQIPEGKIWIHTVQFTTYELDGSSVDGQTEFSILASLPGSLKDQKEIVNSNLLKRLLKQVAQHVEQNKEILG